MRKAGDLINEYFRESRLAKNRLEPIGEGQYGIVYESDTPGNVIKQPVNPEDNFGSSELTQEVDLQSAAADLGIAPQIASVDTFRGGIGNRFEMTDARQNFEMPPVSSQWPTGINAVRVNQQLGQLALKGIQLDDRHVGNIMYNKMTGRPLQLDFGRAKRVEGEDQVIALTNATQSGFKAAGLNDVGDILSDTVYDYLSGGQVAEAMDLAKQGFSRLQKIKQVA